MVIMDRRYGVHVMKSGKSLIVVVSLVLCYLTGAAGFPGPKIENLKTGSLEEQVEAMYYFGYSGNKKAFWYMVKNLERTFDGNDENPWGATFRQAAAVSLGRLGDDRAVPFLLKRYGVEQNEKVKQAILFALGFYKSSVILPVIRDGLSSQDRDTRVEALRAAARFKNSEIAGDIQGITDQAEDYIIKMAGAYALVSLENEPDRYAEVLLGGLTRKEPDIRFWAVYYLSRVERIDAIDDIIRALEIENYSWVRREMERALSVLYESRKRREKDL